MDQVGVCGHNFTVPFGPQGWDHRRQLAEQIREWMDLVRAVTGMEYGLEVAVWQLA